MRDRFFTGLDWAAFWTATIVTFLVYFFTLGPSVGLEDSGELATAAARLGVPHPPGYPFWTFVSWLFCKVFSWVTYMGHPTPAWAVSLCSATFGAFAAGCTAMLICRSGRDFIDSDESEKLSVSILAFAGGVGGALTFAFSPVEWSQSTIVEIYSLNALFLMWVFLLSYRWLRRPSDKILWLTAFVFGLGLTNYQVLLFAIFPLAIIIAMKNIGLFRDVFIYLIPIGLTWQLLAIGQLSRADGSMQSDVINKHLPVGISANQWGRLVRLSDGEVYFDRQLPEIDSFTNACPNNYLIIIALALLLIGIIVAIVLFKRERQSAAKRAVMILGFLGAGLLFLGTRITSHHSWPWGEVEIAPLIEPVKYLLIAAMVCTSVVFSVLAALSVDDIRSTKNLKLPYMIGAILFAGLAIIIALNVSTPSSLYYAGKQFPWAKSTSVFWLLIVVLFGLAAFTKKGLLFAIPVAGLHIAAFILLRNGAMNGLTHPESWWFGWPIVWNFILLALASITLPNGKSVAGAAFFTQLGVSFYVYMPIVSELNPPMNWGYPRTWDGFKHAITRGQYEAIKFPSFNGFSDFYEFFKVQMGHYFGDVKLQFTDSLVWFALVPFAMILALFTKVVEFGRKSLAKSMMIKDRGIFLQWMSAILVCFLMMSFFLIMLANVKGDVQDGFIQKVKFISSHAMIALWIGYGVLFFSVIVVKVLNRYVKPHWIWASVLGGATILTAMICPIEQNYTDDRMVFELGGAEQNGHTFGWQFGAYQLEGANAIKEQLSADEEPLPDPNYPPAMDKFSIFFGGTDPGRFVPTYMIYAAQFRPDIYLITQNALADDTYMSVMRDLYGDEIWIPAKEDCENAFDIYVREVKSGVRAANGDLQIENGRVQVTGALGVMEINGIITEMMYKHDRTRHSFYVEESYAIPWMYPYLSPHGLIMKLNSTATTYDAKIANKDADFWDWYTRRLLDDPMYRRDFAGQKSFSKLRASIAGLYNKQGRYREGSQAFREACILYPAAPEATLRYAQECLIPYRRWEVVLELMDYLDTIDPHNTRTAIIRNQVNRLMTLLSEVDRLEAKQREGKFTDDDSYLLMRCYIGMGRDEEAAQLALKIFERVNNPQKLRMLSIVLMDNNLHAAAETCLMRYLKVNPTGDVEAWIDLAKIQYRTGRKQAAIRNFAIAYQIDEKTVLDRIQTDKELREIASPLLQRR